MKKIIFIIGFVALNIYAAEPQILGKAMRSKIIAVGTAGPTIDYLIKNYQIVEEMLPTDGMVIFLDVPGIRNNKPEITNRHKLFSNWKWEKKWFEPSLKALKKIKFKKLTHNFIYVAVTGAHNYNMFDDDAWKNVCNNISIMAWYAREAGFKGIFFDTEHYNKGYHALFEYNPGINHSFNESWLKARQRGREFMQAIAYEYPDITILTAYGPSTNFDAVTSSDVMKSLSATAYGLLTPFYNGMFDVMPKGAQLMDGCETPGYLASSEADFVKMYADFYRKSPQLLAPSNLSKFFMQSALAPGFFLDCYMYNKGTKWIIRSPEMSRLALMRRNLMLATQYSKGYVWLYSEQCRWFPARMSPGWERAVLKRPGKGRLWEKAMPGITASIEFVRDPEAYIAEKLTAGELEKIFEADFESDNLQKTRLSDGKMRPAYKDLFFWQSGSYKLKGTFTLDKEVDYKNKPSIRFTDIKWGVAGRNLKVKPGEVYFIRAAAKAEGIAVPELVVTWKDSKSKFINVQNNERTVFSRALSNNWYQGTLTVIVPSGVSFMSVQLSNGAWGRIYDLGIKNICWFDDFEVYKVF